jgi:hypothetical protein
MIQAHVFVQRGGKILTAKIAENSENAKNYRIARSSLRVRSSLRSSRIFSAISAVKGFSLK